MAWVKDDMNIHEVTSQNCELCLGYGYVCSAHPDLAWGPGLPGGYFPDDRVCWCGAPSRPCPGVVEEDDEPPRRTLGSHVLEMLCWALAAAAITLVLGIVLNVLEALL
jgi:hypothetical protein